ncbi:hypothetical protein [Lysinibacillus sp. 54212]|uniref:hypothetical protein n=1 Tax=Lysinibacillus sp. 54212 TaxID=3119829 RepID=UPI002FC68EE4
MKKLIFSAALVLSLGLAGCGGDTTKDKPKENKTEATDSNNNSDFVSDASLPNDLRVTEYINKVLGEKTNTDETRVVSVTNDAEGLTVLLNIDENLSMKLIRTSMLSDARGLFNEISQYENLSVVTIGYIDQYKLDNKTNDVRVMSIKFDADKIKSIDWDKYLNDNFEKDAKSYFIHPDFKED